jgi:hypothetical protein
MTRGDMASRNPRVGMGQNVPMRDHLIDWQRLGEVMRFKDAVAREVRRPICCSVDTTRCIAHAGPLASKR